MVMNGGKIQETARVIGFAGELKKKKGLQMLLSAYAQANKTHSSVLLIVGDILSGEDRKMVDDSNFCIQPHILLT